MKIKKRFLFRRMCKRCDSMFEREGEYQKLCLKCFNEIDEARKKKVLAMFKEKRRLRELTINKMKGGTNNK